MLALVAARHPGVRTHQASAARLPLRLDPALQHPPGGDPLEKLVTEACRAAGTDAVPLAHDALRVRWFPEA